MQPSDVYMPLLVNKQLSDTLMKGIEEGVVVMLEVGWQSCSCK
jgi:hypothetical protein